MSILISWTHFDEGCWCFAQMHSGSWAAGSALTFASGWCIASHQLESCTVVSGCLAVDYIFNHPVTNQHGNASIALSGPETQHSHGHHSYGSVGFSSRFIVAAFDWPFCFIVGSTFLGAELGIDFLYCFKD